MRLQGQFYRAHDPRWSFVPLSGKGAEIHGGRFNPVGVPALYLSSSIEGAIAEAVQGFSRKLEPLTLCLYEVDCNDVVDLRDADTLAANAVDPRDLDCGWRHLEAQGRESPSWIMARRFIADQVAGIAVPSFASRAPKDAYNFVLWHWGPDLPQRVTVHDPSGRLPADQLSWSE